MAQRGDTSSIRLFGIGIVVSSLFFALFGRAMYLQVMQRESFQTEAAANQVRIVSIPAPRGRILDRNGRIMAGNGVVQAITAQRRVIKEHKEVIPRLATLLGKSVKEVETRINDMRFSDYRPVVIAEDVKEDTIVYLREHKEDFPGISADQLTRRAYPYASLASNVIGYVGETNENELKSLGKDGYRLGDDIGKTGVERVFERWLRGTPGSQKLEVNSAGRVLRVLDETAPVAGNDLRLTIDLDVQRMAEDSLARAADRLKRSVDRDSGKTFVAPGGASVVLDPRNGAVIAMASFPNYDLRKYVNGVKTEVWKQDNDPNGPHPMRNRVTESSYAPGSTFKLVTALAGLEKGLISPQTTVVDNGKIQIGDREFTNAKKKAYGAVDLVRGLAVSSDVYFYKMGADFWYGRNKFGDAIQEVAGSFGLGKNTGVEVNETPGRIPTPESRKKDHEQNPTAFPEGNWYAGDNVNLSIGQGEVEVTPLQLVNLYATFANGGTLYQPRIGDRIVDGDGKTLHSFEPVVKGKVKMNPASRDAVLAGLHGAVGMPGGTAYGAFRGFDQNAFPLAGKTGTAQVFNKQDTALFVGFGPTNAPKYAVAVVMEEAGFGGVVAAPIARSIFDQLLGGSQKEITFGQGTD